jgi:hypothetical protein
MGGEPYMTAIHAESAYTITDGAKWFAQFNDGLVLVSLSPVADITDVIDVLIPKGRQHMWLLDAYDDDEDGWEVWVLTRE